MKYCDNRLCPFEDCQHHLKHAPYGIAVSTADMDKGCKRYEDHLAREEEIKKTCSGMTIGTAYQIFYNIDDANIDDRMKGTAIMMIANMETHNSVKKATMVKVIKYLLTLAFDIKEDDDHDE